MTAIAEKLPVFTLPATDGSDYSFPAEAAVSVVVFTCNHCPYALAWHERLLAVAREYADRGVRMFFVNPNDAERYPRQGPYPVRQIHDCSPYRNNSGHFPVMCP